MQSTAKEQMENIITDAKEYSKERLDTVLKIEKANKQLNLGEKINPYYIVETYRETNSQTYEDFYDATALFMRESNGMSREEKEAYRDESLGRLQSATVPLDEKVRELEEHAESHSHWYNKHVPPVQKTKCANAYYTDHFSKFIKLDSFPDKLIKAIDITSGNHDTSWYELKQDGVITTRELSRVYSLSDHDETFDSPEKYWKTCEKKNESLSKAVSDMERKLLSGRLSDKAFEDFFDSVDVAVYDISIRKNSPAVDAEINKMKQNLEEVSRDLYQEIDDSREFREEIKDNALSHLLILSNDISEMSPYADEYTNELFVREMAKAVEAAENDRLPESVQKDISSEIKECINSMGKIAFENTLDDLKYTLAESKYGKKDVKKTLDIVNNYCRESGLLLDIRSIYEVQDDISLCLSAVNSMLSKNRMLLQLGDAEYFAEEDFRSKNNEHSKDICKYVAMSGIEYNALSKLCSGIKKECEWMLDHAENEFWEDKAKDLLTEAEKIKTDYIDPAEKKLDGILEAGKNDPNIVSAVNNIQNGTLAKEQMELITSRERLFVSEINELEMKYIRPSFKQDQQKEQSIELA